MQDKCFCDSEKSFSECCELIISGKTKAKTALELMRSRYSAYVLRNGQYLYETCSEKLKNIEEVEAVNRDKTQWICLKVESFSENEVTFMAYYKENNHIFVMKEKSLFINENGNIRYDSGKMIEAEIGRNETCPCGSGKKYKKCCG